MSALGESPEFDNEEPHLGGIFQALRGNAAFEKRKRRNLTTAVVHAHRRIQRNAFGKMLMNAAARRAAKSSRAQIWKMGEYYQRVRQRSLRTALLQLLQICLARVCLQL